MSKLYYQQQCSVSPLLGENELMQVCLTLTVTHMVCHSKDVQAALTFRHDKMIQAYSFVEISAFT